MRMVVGGPIAYAGHIDDRHRVDVYSVDFVDLGDDVYVDDGQRSQYISLETAYDQKNSRDVIPHL